MSFPDRSGCFVGSLACLGRWGGTDGGEIHGVLSSEEGEVVGVLHKVIFLFYISIIL